MSDTKKSDVKEDEVIKNAEADKSISAPELRDDDLEGISGGMRRTADEQ